MMCQIIWTANSKGRGVTMCMGCDFLSQYLANFEIKKNQIVQSHDDVIDQE